MLKPTGFWSYVTTDGAPPTMAQPGQQKIVGFCSALGLRLGERHTLVQLGQQQLDADLRHGKHRIA